MDSALEKVFKALEEWDTVIDPADAPDLENKYNEARDSFLESKGLGGMRPSDFRKSTRDAYSQWRRRLH
jgi:hypothetical protein